MKPRKKRSDANATRKIVKVDQSEIEKKVKHVPVRGEDGLTDKAMMFVAEYLVDFDATRAAIAAGYSKKTASVKGCQLLKKPDIIRVVKQFQKEDLAKCQLTREEILLQLYYCATRSASDFCDENGRIITDVHRLDKRAQNTIDGIEQTVSYDQEGNEVVRTKLRLVPKAEAINMALKHMGLYAPDKHDVTIAPGLDFNKLAKEDRPPDEIEAELTSPVVEEDSNDLANQPRDVQ
ncbi:terminase small subunit [Candidatus Pacearchaeota archaeon]|jgi:phage terminase small subunit|nr:terminase small subunit [Candidatus Pacearchaeota archaeon]